MLETSGYTQSEVADAVGVPLSALKSSIRAERVWYYGAVPAQSPSKPMAECMPVKRSEPRVRP